MTTLDSTGSPGRAAAALYFYGTFEHAIDERGRVAVPARYRRVIQEGAVLRGGPEGCLELYTQEGFVTEAAQRLGAEASTRERSARRSRRGFMAGAFDVELDKQGRILLPQPLREYGALNGRALFIGCGDYIELWSPEAWAHEQAVIAAEEQA